jgi:pimeloyl-ACP methyl ester carboxylesterase
MACIGIDGMRLHYVEHGLSDGPPLVLLHGFNQMGDFWVNQLENFGERYRGSNYDKSQRIEDFY